MFETLGTKGRETDLHGGRGVGTYCKYVNADRYWSF